MAEFVPYSDENHRAQFLELNVEYLDYARTQESGLFKDKAAVRDYVERFLPKFTEVRPPEGIILILEVDDKVAGMGALKKLDEGVAEVKRMYIRPEYRGRGYGKEMLDRLIEKSKGFGLGAPDHFFDLCRRAGRRVLFGQFSLVSRRRPHGDRRYGADPGAARGGLCRAAGQ